MLTHVLHSRPSPSRQGTTRRRTRISTLVAIAAAFLGMGPTGPADAQTPVPRVSVGFGVDTTIADVRDVVHLIRAYLAKPDSSARSRGLWSIATPFDRRVGDPTTSRVYLSFAATVVGVVPAPDAHDDSAYVVKVLYARADSTGKHVTPLALQRLYAVRETGGPFPFRLRSVLPRITRSWERRSRGRITFWYAPGQHANEAKINRATRFVDSVATLFNVTPPEQLDVYVTASTDEAQRTIGLDFFPEASGPGEGHSSVTLPFGVILVGDPKIGEDYLHELTHAMLSPTLGASAMFSEGVATWLGGSQGRTPAEMYALLHRYQIAHPSVTLANLFHEDPVVGNARTWTDVMYATDARIVDTVYRRAGIPGLRVLAGVHGNADAILAALSAQLGLDGADKNALERWWRDTTGVVQRSAPAL